MAQLERVKEYIQNKEKNTLTSAIEEFTGELKFLNFFKNDKDLQDYAELSLKSKGELTLKDSLKMAKLEMLLPIKCEYFEEFKKFLEDMKQDEGSESKSEKTPGESSEGGTDSSKDSSTGTPSEGGTDSSKDSSTGTPSEGGTDSSKDSGTGTASDGGVDSNQNSSTEISSEIEDANVEEIAHLGSNWQTRKKGEKLVVDKEERKKFLFADGLPKTKEEMESKYLVTINVPICDGKGNIKEKELQVHKKLANSYIAIFEELADKKIKIDGSATGSYCWRKIRRGNRMSDHSYGTAIDVNWSYNGGVYGKTDMTSIYYNTQTTVEIFKKYGFARGGDRSAKSDDPMHFTYMGG